MKHIYIEKGRLNNNINIKKIIITLPRSLLFFVDILLKEIEIEREKKPRSY